MLKKVTHYGHVLTDNIGMPRYWAAAWCLLVGGSLAESTLKKRLSNIDAFYQHTESDLQFGFLDDALGRQDLPLLEELLESYFVTLRNVPEVGVTAEQRWRDAVGFTREISERLSRTPELSERFADLGIRLERLDRLYGQLRMTRKTTPHFVRALPASVMSELYDAVLPGSTSNPFKTTARAGTTCAGTSKIDYQGNAWSLVLAGTCEKTVSKTSLAGYGQFKEFKEFKESKA